MDYDVVAEGPPAGMTALEIASARQRLGAWLIDHMIVAGIFLGTATVAGVVLYVAWSRDMDEFNEGWWFVGVIIVSAIIGGIATLVWYVYLLHLVATRGQTPGKRVVKIRIIKDDGGKVGWGVALMREVVGKIILVAAMEGVLAALVSVISAVVAVYIWIFVLLALLIWIVADEKNQTLHDKIARTYVVKVRSVAIEHEPA